MTTYSYPTKNPDIEKLDVLAEDRFGRPFVELDVDQRIELQELLDDAHGDLNCVA
jgi:hypothetical protein